MTTKQSTRNSTKNVRRIFLNLYCKIINFYGALMRSEILLNSGFIPQICGVFVRRIFVKAFVEKNHNFYIRKTILSKAGEKPEKFNKKYFLIVLKHSGLKNFVEFWWRVSRFFLQFLHAEKRLIFKTTKFDKIYFLIVFKHSPMREFVEHFLSKAIEDFVESFLVGLAVRAAGTPEKRIHYVTYAWGPSLLS